MHVSTPEHSTAHASLINLTDAIMVPRAVLTSRRDYPKNCSTVVFKDLRVAASMLLLLLLLHRTRMPFVKPCGG